MRGIAISDEMLSRNGWGTVFMSGVGSSYNRAEDDLLAFESWYPCAYLFRYLGVTSADSEKHYIK